LILIILFPIPYKYNCAAFAAIFHAPLPIVSLLKKVLKTDLNSF